MGEPEIESFLSHLAINLNVSSSTQNQALSALLLLYWDVLKTELDDSIDADRAKKPSRLPVSWVQAESWKWQTCTQRRENPHDSLLTPGVGSWGRVGFVKEAVQSLG